MLGVCAGSHYIHSVARNRQVPRRDCFWRMTAIVTAIVTAIAKTGVALAIEASVSLVRWHVGDATGAATGGRENLDRGIMANPFRYLQQVRSETSKVTWPTRRETLVTTALVIVMVFIASLFFLAVDWTIKELLTLLLSITK